MGKGEGGGWCCKVEFKEGEVFSRGGMVGGEGEGGEFCREGVGEEQEVVCFDGGGVEGRGCLEGEGGGVVGVVFRGEWYCGEGKEEQEGLFFKEGNVGGLMFAVAWGQIQVGVGVDLR